MVTYLSRRKSHGILYVQHTELFYRTYTCTYTANNIACKTRMTATNSQQFKTRKSLFYKYIHLCKIVTAGNIELWHLFISGKLVSEDFPTFHNHVPSYCPQTTYLLHSLCSSYKRSKTGVKLHPYCLDWVKNN